MNQQQAGEILWANVAYLQEPLKSAVEFTLEKFYPPPSAAELAKNFLASLPLEIFMANDLHEVNPELKSQIDAAYFTLQNNSDVWLSLENLSHEQWRPVVGYEGLYEVSNYGRVKTLFKGVSKIRKPVFTNKPGYFGVNLYKENVSRLIRIHVLVARAFVPNPENKPVVNHKDANKRNNQVSNLEWVTQSENLRHAYDIGLQKIGCEHWNSKFTEEQIRYIRETCIPGDLEFGISALARKFGVNIATISEMYHGKTYKKVT